MLLLMDLETLFILFLQAVNVTIQNKQYRCFLNLIFVTVIFLPIVLMVQKIFVIILIHKGQSIPFHLKQIPKNHGIAIIGFTKNVIQQNVFSIKSKLFVELLLVMINLLLLFSLLFILLLYAFQLNSTIFSSFQIRPNPILSSFNSLIRYIF